VPSTDWCSLVSIASSLALSWRAWHSTASTSIGPGDAAVDPPASPGGGYAWADNRLALQAPGATLFSESKMLSGWTIGGGLEYMFAPNWSGKVEYMFADYGSERYLRAFAPAGIELGATVHTVKGGINYHFNWGGPVVARY
jgi:opacity protein-like surface antigen